MNNNLLFSIPGIEAEELQFIQEAIKDMDDSRKQQFVLLYQGRRKDPQTILLCTLLGFVVVAGVQRFILGQMGMGILYLLTAGLCFVGTIVDLINYKSLTLEYNRRQVIECKMMAGGSF
jgi:TM2 domain-containing membrane protein YozV